MAEVPAPLAIGPVNCEAMLGVSWRWLRDHAPSLGLTIYRVGSKSFIDARAAYEAIRKHGKPEPPAVEPEPEDVDAVLARWGKRRRYR